MTSLTDMTGVTTTSLLFEATVKVFLVLLIALAVVWSLRRRSAATGCLRRDSEQACDDAVLGLGVNGPDYATQLLNLAKTFRSPHAVLSPPARQPRYRHRWTRPRSRRCSSAEAMARCSSRSSFAV